MVTFPLRQIWLAALVAVASVWSAQPAGAETRSTGTAFVVHSEGLLLTCFHVVKDAGRIDVRLNGKVYRAMVVGTDVNRDLALLQVDATSLPALPWIKAEEVELGEEVRAFGFPLTSALGSSLKVTRGTISGVEREEGQPVFQIDSAVNPGNSGGPLVNDRGEVVGVVVARFEDVMGVGYVTPVDAASPLLRGLPLLRPTERRTRFEGPALVHYVSPSVALVSCVSVDQTGKLPVPFKRDFPTAASARLPVPAPAPLAAANPVPTPMAERPSTPPVEKPVAKVEAPVVPARPAAAPAQKPAIPVDKPTAPAIPVSDPKKPEVAANKVDTVVPAKPAAAAPVPATQPLAATVPKTETPAAKPNPPVVPPAAKPEGTAPPVKPVPAPPMPAKLPEIDVDAELCKIRATDPPEFPQPAAQAVTDTVRAEWTITNATDAPLTIMFRGVEKRAVVIEPRKSVTLMLMPGTYEVAGRLALDTISPFYGTQEFTRGGRYQSRFRVELQ